jgi:hypothetical protein
MARLTLALSPATLSKMRSLYDISKVKVRLFYFRRIPVRSADRTLAGTAPVDVQFGNPSGRLDSQTKAAPYPTQLTKETEK